MFLTKNTHLLSLMALQSTDTLSSLWMSQNMQSVMILLWVWEQISTNGHYQSSIHKSVYDRIAYKDDKDTGWQTYQFNDLMSI